MTSPRLKAKTFCPRHLCCASLMSLFFAKHPVLIPNCAEKAKQHAYQPREAFHQKIQASFIA